MRRAAALFLLLFAVYAATIGVEAFEGSEYAGDEPHYLLTAKSLVDDTSPDLRDEYAAGEYREFYPYDLAPDGSLTRGRVNEPHGVGFPALVAPAYAIAGDVGVQVFIAALAALAIALGYRLALRVVPDPWAFGAAAAVGLSPPLVAYSTAVYPELPAAAALTGATLLVLRIRERPTRRVGWSAFLLLALLPWLGTKYLIPAAVVLVYGFRAMRRAGRPVLAITCVEIVGFSVAVFVGLNEGLYDGPTPYAAESPGETATGAEFPLGYLERSYRLAALFVDRDHGLLRWAPVLALALYGAWLLLRDRRSGLARFIPGLRDEQAAGALCAAVVGSQLVVAAFLAPTMFEFAFPGRQLVVVLPVAVALVGLGLRRAPRTGAALALLGVVASAWTVVRAHLGDGALVAGLPDAPWGPLVGAFPLFERGSFDPFVVAGFLGAAVVALIVGGELSRSRRVSAA